MGDGKKLIKEAIKYAKNNLGIKIIELGVFIDNKNALWCYKSVVF